MSAQHPQSETAPEQTASILSLATFSYMDCVLWKAQKVAHMTKEDLPPNADFDYAANLKKRAFPVCFPLLFRIHPLTDCL